MIKSLIFMIIFLLIILSSCEKTEEYFPEASPDYVQKAGVDDLFLSDESRIRGGKTEPEIYVQMGHVSGSFSYTNAVQFIGGGKYFLSGNGDGTIKLWNTLSGREIRTFNCEDDVTNLDISKDGRLLVSGDMSDMKNINLWDISSGKKIKFVNSHMDMSCNGYPVLFCNDDRNIISGGSESTLRLWDIESGEMIRDYKAKADSSVNPDVSAIVLTPDGKSVIAGYRYNAQGVESQDFTIRIWNLETGEEIIAFNKANGWVETLGIKPDGKYLISGDWQQDSVRIWDVETGKQMAAYHTGGTSAIDVSAGGRYALLGGCMGFRLIELSTGKNIRTINKGIEGWVRSIKFSPDGKYALVGDDLSKPMLWDLESGSLVTEYGGYANKLETAKLSKTGNIMLTADDYTDAIRIWDYRNGILIKTIARDSSSLMSCATISADGSLMATGGWNGRTSNAIVWDIASSKKIARMELEEESGNHTGFLQITDDNKYLIWATQVKLTISDLRSGKEVAQIADSTHGFRSIFAEPNGNYLLISSYTGGFKMFSVPDGRFIKNISDGKDINYIFGNEYLYEFKSIKNAFGDWQRYLTQYDLKNLEEKSRSKINEFYFNFGIGQSRETLFFCHNFAKDISKYDINKNQVVTAFTGHTRPITNLDLTPDGKFLCSGSIDGTARFWNPETGKEVAQFIAFKGGEWIVITPKGYFNASPNGAKYLNVRVGNQVYSIDNFHEKYFNPAYVASVLQGKRIEATDDIR
ncbi:MAG: WD40 repeat domain-containing protein, partial [Calditrichaceae bacterium]|nr:WD40 repeat domain-containing protein [Calditrichaceae bacterium]